MGHGRANLLSGKRTNCIPALCSHIVSSHQGFPVRACTSCGNLAGKLHRYSPSLSHPDQTALVSSPEMNLFLWPVYSTLKRRCDANTYHASIARWTSHASWLPCNLAFPPGPFLMFWCLPTSFRFRFYDNMSAAWLPVTEMGSNTEGLLLFFLAFRLLLLLSYIGADCLLGRKKK